jgi:hypothetical protein
MPLGMTRPLRAALRATSTPAELLVVLGQPAPEFSLPPSLTLGKLTDAAAHQAALRRQPYMSPEHVALAAARAAGDDQLAEGIARRLDDVPVLARRRWRPLGRGSALRPRSQRLLDDQQRAALQREELQREEQHRGEASSHRTASAGPGRPPWPITQQPSG